PGASGVLVHKLADQGYQLRVAEDGSLVLRLVHADGSAELSSSGSIADGTWHHILVEADRADGQLRIYIDGQEDASGAGIDDSVDLSNLQDLYVGGTPDGEHLAVELDFLRIARGSLQRSRTTIEELYAWQFDGPVLRDFAGHEPTGVRRDAGALELRP
ncbi:MAG: LamG-like jellyroll fold domain-containing protein, partial [Planctomycetota bacterium]